MLKHVVHDHGIELIGRIPETVEFSMSHREFGICLMRIWRLSHPPRLLRPSSQHRETRQVAIHLRSRFRAIAQVLPTSETCISIR